MDIIGRIKRLHKSCGASGDKGLKELFDKITSSGEVSCKRFGDWLECPGCELYVLCNERQVVVVFVDTMGIENELADEEEFNDEEPLWFSEFSHRVSPFYYASQVADAVMESRKAVIDEGPKQKLVVLVTNAGIINYDDYIDEYHARKGVVFHKSSGLWINQCYDNVKGEQIIEEFDKDIYVQVHNLPSYNVKSPAERSVDPAVRLCNRDIDDDIDDTDDDDDDEEFMRLLDEFVGPESKRETLPLPDLDLGTLPVTVMPCLVDPDKKFEKLVGLTDVRDHLNRMVAFGRFAAKVRQMRPDAETPMQLNLHTIMVGNPGSGKTTMAQYYASQLHKAGLLSHGHTILANRSAFVGQNFGCEEERMRQALHAAKGGVLFIDEAGDMINHPHPHDPGKAVFALMLQMLADEKQRDTAVVLALYNDTDLEKLYSFNPGFKSRFVNVLHLPDYSLAELETLSRRRVRDMGLEFTPKAFAAFRNLLKKAYDTKDVGWGNARAAINLIEKVVTLHAVRCDRRKIEGDALLKITARDIPPYEAPQSPTLRRKVGF